MINSEFSQRSRLAETFLPGSPAGHGRLDKRGATLTPAAADKAQGQGKTVSRWRLKHRISEILRAASEDGSTPGVCKCGTARHGNDEKVDLTRKAGRPGVQGVFFCDSPWICPTCAPRRAAERAERVLEVFDAVEAMGGRTVFITLTARHDRKTSLEAMKTMISAAGRKARQGRPWALARERWGIPGVIVSPEVTDGKKHGWHYHLHIGMPVLAGDDEAALEAGEWLRDRYMRYIRQAGGSCLLDGQDVQVIWRREDAADYLSKGSAAWEVASAGATKEGRRGDSPWDLAAKAARGDARAAARFAEYAAVMPGTRSCVISPALAARLDLEAVNDEDEPGERQPETDEVEIVASVLTEKWNRLLRRGCAPDVLDLVARGGDALAVHALIDRLLPDQAPVEVVPDGMSARQLARAARTVQHGRSRLSAGGAVQIVLDRARDNATRRGRPFVPPDLKTTLSLMADGIV